MDPPYRCVICKFGAELDDCIAPPHQGRCICLRCFLREVGAPSPMPADLRKAIEAAMVGA